MKNLLLVFLLLTSSFAFASDIDDMFGDGEDQFVFDRFSDESILLEIDRAAAISCDKGLCTLHSMESRYGGFEVSFGVGEGNGFQAGGKDGVNIYTDGYGACNTCGQLNWGFQVKYSKGKCTQTVKVPKSVYYAVNRYMYGLMTDEGGTRRGFTPADEAMIMFYTTIMNNVKGCTKVNIVKISS
ncbi:hypothetical protein [Bacteriovorax sp. DB6_IX]|uniref:hypothetical protein n=2 Tax=Bacteriovorax sp. DB6_IX TaxID=1353530 RepID=UPI00038A2D2D|nr:hypothetical protein [Bacteriovorax sp. DB6_IX]EQC50499.1 hypothetical protein M901_1885 [Bacteriovorax sp. DB6_IX]